MSPDFSPEEWQTLKGPQRWSSPPPEETLGQGSEGLCWSAALLVADGELEVGFPDCSLRFSSVLFSCISYFLGVISVFCGITFFGNSLEKGNNDTENFFLSFHV